MNLGDVRHIPADNEQYDCVTAFSLLHHLARKNKTESGEQVASAYKEIFRVLKLGGVLVVAENCPGAFGMALPSVLFRILSTRAQTF